MLLGLEVLKIDDRIVLASTIHDSLRGIAAKHEPFKVLFEKPV
jgi:hypothetical protein